jgi:RNA polymerase sigma factor (sigma-70 family)
MKKIKYSDHDLKKGIVLQSSDVLMYIYKENYKSIKRYIEENSGSEKDAEDIFQDALILIYSKLKNNELFLTCSFSTYLFAIVKTNWLKVLRQRRNRNITIEECDSFIDDEEGIHEELIQIEKKRLVIHHFKEISKDCQEIIQLIIKGCTLEEITKLMNYNSVQYTKNRKLKCKKALIGKIINNPRFKELTNGKVGENYQIPRW